MNRAATELEVLRDRTKETDPWAAGRRRGSGRSAVGVAGRAAPLLVLMLAVAAMPVMAADPESSQSFDRGAIELDGLSLAEALSELTSAGLKIVFTDRVVTDGMKVQAEPDAMAPRELLEQLLAPHGLEARAGPSETWVVVPRSVDARGEGSTIRGVVRSQVDMSPIAGASIRIVETGIETSTGEFGAFRLGGPATGPFTLEVRHASYTDQRHESIPLSDAREVGLALFLSPAAIFEEEMVITPSRVSLMRQEPVTALDLGRDEILALPHLADDFYRALSVLPGITANDISAEFHVRGGRRDETQVLLDGQELYEAYHLKDYDSALSFVASAALGSADLTTGGFLVEHGDRMSGVLDMTTLVPTGPAKIRIGVGLLSAQVGGAGGFDDDRGRWFVEVRRGTIDLASRLFGSEDPQYWDAFGKAGFDLGPRNSLHATLLTSSDELTFLRPVPGEQQRIETDYDSMYAWLTHDALLSRRLTLQTSVSWTDLFRDRNGFELEEDARFTVEDGRDSEIAEFRQEWNLDASWRHHLKWGFAFRQFDSLYDYFSAVQFNNAVSEVRDRPELEGSRFLGRFKDRHNALHVADRMQLSEPLMLELGLRYDHHSLTDETIVSPRVNLAVSVGETGVVRAAWGKFNQSQRPYELMVEDGDTNIYPLERAEHRILGFEKLIGASRPLGGLALRVELYDRAVENPRPRFENLYEPINFFPEVEPDRVRIEPQESRARGVEVFLRGRGSRRLGWWINYAWATTEDRIAGDWIPRQYDQPHTFRFDLDYRLGTHWTVNLAWRFHTGWPTTPIGFTTEVGEAGEIGVAPILGPLYSERLGTYHRLDLRAGRQWSFQSSVLTLFIDVQNLYDRQNPAGFDVALDEENGLVVLRETWPGIFPSAGIRFEF